MKNPQTASDCADKETKDFKTKALSYIEQENQRRTVDDLKRPFNRYEQQVLHFLFTTSSFIDLATPATQRRLSAIVRGKMRMGLIRWAAWSLFQDFVSQMDASAARKFTANCKSMQINITPRRVDSVDGLRYISDNDLDSIATAAIEGNCMMCSKRGLDAKRCRLKKALDQTQISTAGDHPDCWYKEI